MWQCQTRAVAKTCPLTSHTPKPTCTHHLPTYTYGVHTHTQAAEPTEAQRLYRAEGKVGSRGATQGANPSAAALHPQGLAPSMIPPAYKFLAIYEIVSIRQVAGGVRTTQPHTSPAGAGAAPNQRHRGTAAAQGSGSSSSSGEAEEEEWAP